MRTSLVLFVFCLLANLTSLQGQIMADSIASKFELINSKEVQAHINDKGSSFEDVRESNSWSPYSSELSVNSKQALWLKFDLKNNSKDTIRNYIYSDTPSNTIYQVFKNDVKVFKNGRLIPLPQRTKWLRRR